ncbi:MAG: sn-glycerol-3-phosphate ABC transporter ATP-binding protein UgpC [Dongiaceae bacterium]
MAEIVIDGVRKSFGSTVAVAGVSLAIPDGAFVILVGPSGCGKTTLLRMLAGLEEVSDGRIHIGGKDVTQAHPRDRDIAMVFQSYALYPHMTARRNMEFALEMRHLPRAEIDRRVAAAVEILDIGHLLERRPRQLSGGQRQRVALGRAIVREPAAFLFDEPLSNLDAKLRTSMRGELIKLHKRLGATIVYVTHDQVEAMTMGERIVVMKDGVVQQQGSPMEVYGDPDNRFVADFIGSPAMNFIEGRLEGGRARASRGALALPLSPALAALGDRPATFGIRPEHIAVERSPGAPGAVPAVVEVVEPLGAETVVEVTAAGETLVVRVPGELGVGMGAAIGLRIDPDRLLAFDHATGARIRAA